MTIDRSSLRELAERVRKSPWTWEPMKAHKVNRRRSGARNLNGWITWTEKKPAYQLVMTDRGCVVALVGDTDEGAAELVATMNALPALLNLLDTLEAERDRLREQNHEAAAKRDVELGHALRKLASYRRTFAYANELVGTRVDPENRMVFNGLSEVGRAAIARLVLDKETAEARLASALKERDDWRESSGLNGQRAIDADVEITRLRVRLASALKERDDWRESSGLNGQRAIDADVEITRLRVRLASALKERDEALAAVNEDLNRAVALLDLANDWLDDPDAWSVRERVERFLEAALAALDSGAKEEGADVLTSTHWNGSANHSFDPDCPVCAPPALDGLEGADQWLTLGR